MVNAIFSVGVGGTFFVAQMLVEGQRASDAEVLANVTYIRETIRDGGAMNFQNMNLRGANLVGLDFGCDLSHSYQGILLVGEMPENGEDRLVAQDADLYSRNGCANLNGSDLTGAILDGADFTGATLHNVVFAPASAASVTMTGARLSGKFDVTFGESSDLRGVKIIPSGESDLITLPRNRIEFHITDATGATIETQELSGPGPATDVRFVDALTFGVMIQGNATVDWGSGCLPTWEGGSCTPEYPDHYGSFSEPPISHIPDHVGRRFHKYWKNHQDIIDWTLSGPIY